MLKFKLEINYANNPRIISRLMYYIYLNAHLYDENTNTSFVLDDTMDIADKFTICIFPKDMVCIKYEEQPIHISHKKTRDSLVFQTTEIRFDEFTVSSDVGLKHITDFLYMIDKNYAIPNTPPTELGRYIWKDTLWIYNKTFKRRNLDTIYFHKKDYIVRELEKFLTDEKMQKFYERLDIPYKKIFLFHGIPGTGKSSIIRALASNFNYKLCIVKNMKNMDDSTLENMMNGIKPKSFLVFEDIDSMFVKRESKTNNHITFSGLLNILDGIGRYSKLVIFITTNFIGQVDSAIRRRIDVSVEFGHLCKTEIESMLLQFFPELEDSKKEKFYHIVKNKKITANSMEKFFIYCIQHDKDIIDDIKYLDEYNSFSAEDKIPEFMYY